MSRPWFLLLALTACDEVGAEADLFAADEPLDAYAVESLPADANGIPPVVTMAGTCPGPVTFTISGNTPGGQVRLARSPNLAPGTPLGAPCAGTTLRIGPPATLGPALFANGAGVATVSAVLPPAWCGRYVQPLDVTTCTTGMFLQL